MVELMNQRKLVDNAFKRADAEQKEGCPRFSVAPSLGWEFMAMVRRELSE
jgi:hypothetical protein